MTRGKKPTALPPALAGLGDFWATVHVRFLVALPDADDPAASPARGYYRNFGIRAAPERVRAVLAGLVSDGVIDWSDTKWDLVDAEDLDRRVKSRSEAVEGEGIWYKSGRVLYADPDVEPLPI